MRIVKPPDNQPWPLYQAEANLLHYPILKNGHSSLSDWLKGRDLGFETYIRDYHPAGAVAFAVIRHPFDRYISALAQMYRIEAVPDISWTTYINGVERFNRRTSRPWTCRGDRHFFPQWRTVERMPEDRTLLRLGDYEGLMRFLKGHGLESGQVLDHQKPTDVEWVEYARATLTEEIVLRDYRQDLELWEAVSDD